MTTRMKPCPECEGQGWVAYERTVSASGSVPYGYIEEYIEDCSNCGGDGEIEFEDEDEDDDDEEEEERGDWLYHKMKDEEMDRG